MEEGQPAPDAVMSDAGGSSTAHAEMHDAPGSSGTSEVQMADDCGMQTRLFVSVGHATALGDEFACTLVCERDEWFARKQLDYWLTDLGLPPSELHPYVFREFVFGTFSVAVVCANTDHEFIQPLDEWARPDLASRKLFVYKDVFIGCPDYTDLNAAAGALVVAVDAHDAAAITANVLQERGVLPHGRRLSPGEFVEVPRHDGAFGVYPMSIYTTEQ